MDLARLNDPTTLVRVSELLTLLAVSHTTFYEWKRLGKVPSPDIELGKRPLWRAATVRRILGMAQLPTDV